MRIKTLLLLSALGGIAYAQTVTTFAGKPSNDPYNKYESTSGVALTNTYFSLPSGLCFDNNGKMYISDLNKVRIVENNKLYIRAGFLGTPTNSEGYKNGTGTQASFRVPGGMISDADGNIFVCDVDNHCIRKISKFNTLGSGQFITTFAGANPVADYGVEGSANGSGTSARFNGPTDIAIDGSGNFYVTDINNATVRKITSSGTVTTLAGSAGNVGTDDGTGGDARLGRPWGVAMYDANNLVVSDIWNTNIRMININTGVVTTVAGPSTGSNSQIKDGGLSDALFKAPKGIAVVEGIIYVADENVIRAIDIANDKVTTICGNKSSYGLADGQGSSATFTQLADLATDGNGNLYACESSLSISSNTIRKIHLDFLDPGADFVSDKTNLLLDEHAILTDVSTGIEATSRKWTVSTTNFDNHTGNLTSKTLELSFKATGAYHVTLEIENKYGKDTLYKTNFFTVSNTGRVQQVEESHLFTVYPNPSQSYVNFKAEGDLMSDQSVITLYDMMGKKVGQYKVTDQINTSVLPKGTYVVLLENNERRFAKKLVVN